MNRVLPVALIGAAAIAWASVPVGEAGGWGVALIVAASLAVAAGALRLALGDRPSQWGPLLPGTLDRLGDTVTSLLVVLAWEVIASVSLVVLEVLHPARPWHTCVLGVLVASYLLAVHRAEAIVPRGALARPARLSALGLGLLVLTAGIASLPSSGRGALAAWLEVLSALAAIVVAAMVLPV